MIQLTTSALICGCDFFHSAHEVNVDVNMMELTQYQLFYVKPVSITQLIKLMEVVQKKKG